MKTKTAFGMFISCSLFAMNLAGAEKWDMPLAYSASNYHTQIAAEFAAAVTEATQGELEIVTHPNGSLYKGSEIYEAVQTGKAPIGERLISALGAVHPIFEIDVLPFLVDDFDDARKLYSVTRSIIESRLEQSGLILLYAVPWPPQGLYTKQPINGVDDMKGTLFRAYNDSTSRLAVLMGAMPTNIEEVGISEAFASGMAESMISSSATGYDRKIWEYVSHWYDVHAWIPKNMVFANREAWNRLDADTRATILDAALAAETAGWATAQELSEWYKANLVANGMAVLPASDRLKADLVSIGKTMMLEWLSRADEIDKAAIEAYHSEQQ